MKSKAIYGNFQPSVLTLQEATCIFVINLKESNYYLQNTQMH